MCDGKKGLVAEMTEPMKLEFKEYPIVEPTPGGVIVKVLQTNICGSELHIWKGLHPVIRSGALGHEMIGEIFALGEGVTEDFAGQPIKVGDRVVSAYFLTCRKCKPCQEGQFNLCENAYKFWRLPTEQAPHFHGTFGTHYYIHPDQYFYKVPDEIRNNVAASANCALSQVYFGLETGQVKAGETILVQGAGGLGLNAIAVAKEKNLRVIAVDAVDSRLEQAKQFGADEVISFTDYPTLEARVERVHELTDGAGVDVAMEVTGVPAAFSEGVHHIRVGGRYIAIGNISPGQTVAFDPGLLTRKAITIYPVLRYHPWYLKKSLDFLARNIDRYPFETLLDAEFKLEDIKGALDKSASREVTRATIVLV
ncbi:zinc-binding dehydrogenase [Sporosarcina sp. ACRSL]|uniref:zinc-binding dehydrogenase n=1 Tax=Sporosarcina sp. ACRSL TaxID=2918215 RepID=UPI001EF53DB3|nr:zinc-binding dehydrogenase [Sporosarcina sp. ACRSL]MCG7344796.1 zinc-binding dehydrogenase [Sporosarcina sp. ACRSL]